MHNILHCCHAPPTKTKWDILVSDFIMQQLPNNDIAEFLTMIESLPPVLRRNLGALQNIQGLRQLGTSIEMENLLAVADASLGTRGRAFHAYVIESRCRQYRIVGVAPVDSDEDDIESTRAELWGQIAVQTVINIISELFSVNTGGIYVYGDNVDSLVHHHHLRSSKMAFPRFFKPNVDLKVLLQRLWKEFPTKIQITPQHVKGHQDRNENFDYDQASQTIQRNIDIGELSKFFL